MIISSLLDTDLYKLTMMQGVLHQFPWAEVAYEFTCRDATIDLSPVADAVRDEIDHLCSLRFTKEELEYFGQLRFIKPDFIQFLRLFQLNREFIEVTAKNGLAITIKGPWLHTILFEVPVLAIVNELYYRRLYPNPDFAEARRRLDKKIAIVEAANKDGVSIKFSDFGTRRRFSKNWQEEVATRLKESLPQNFRGSSNVFLAKKLGIRPIGTMAHEWLMAGQALGPRLAYSQRFMLEHWAQEYRGDLGIALSDVVGFDAFLDDFDMYFAKLFDGCRHDSGEPFEWGDKLIEHYRNMKIDPRTRSAVFSDGLTFEKARELAQYFQGRIMTGFGIGTNLTNDVVAGEPIQIVIKMTRCQNAPVAKISDSPGKQMCKDNHYLDYLRSVFTQ